MQSSLQLFTKRLTVGISVASIIVLSGCQSTQRLFNKIDNGSLDYQQAQQLEPIEIPVDQPTAPFTPLYPTPDVGENTLNLTDESGSRYKLPAPSRAETVATLQD